MTFNFSNSTSEVETSLFPSYFSLFPVRTYCNILAIEEAMRHAIEGCSEPGSKEWKRAIQRHKGPVNLYAVTYSGVRTEKVQFVAKLIELHWIHDDINEEKPHQLAIHEHEVLRQALHPQFDKNTDTGETVGAKKAYFRKVRQDMMALDPIDTPDVLNTLEQYLKEYDSQKMDAKTIDEFLPKRLINGGLSLCVHLLRWSMDIHLSEDEFTAVKDFEDAIMMAVSLTNDYFSWGKERYLSTDRQWNALPILMKQFTLPEKEAKLMLKGMIVNQEICAKNLRTKLAQGSEDFQQYIAALEYFVGGNLYWSSSCAGYNMPENE